MRNMGWFAMVIIVFTTLKRNNICFKNVLYRWQFESINISQTPDMDIKVNSQHASHAVFEVLLNHVQAYDGIKKAKLVWDNQATVVHWNYTFLLTCVCLNLDDSV